MSSIGKATWIHHLPKEGPDAVRQVARRLADAGFDLVIPCIKNPDGYIDYHGQVANVRPDFKDWDPLRVLTEEARKVGIKVHPWCCVFPEGDGSKLLQEHPEYAALDPSGELVKAGRGSYRYGFACAARPEAHDYEFAMYEELMDNYDIDGVHLDYIRYNHPGNGQHSCFCAYCRETFQKQTGYEPSIDPATRDWAAWIDWKTAAVTRFVKRLSKSAKAKGKEVSAAVFPEYPECIPNIGQDWEDWARRGFVDFLFPMNYTMNTRIAIKRTRNHVTALAGSGVPLWEGLWNRPALSTPMLMEQVRGALAQGVQGIVIFEYYGLDEEDLRALSQVT